MRNIARKPADAGKEVDSVLSAVRPVLHLAQPKSSTKPDTGKSGEVRAINRPAKRRQLSPVEEELREFYQKMEEKTTVQPLLEVATASTGANSAEVDDTGKLDAALAHGNPISRYIRTRKEEEYTDDDYVEVDGVRCLAPERMRRQVVSTTRKGDYVWDLVPDYLLMDTVVVSNRMSIVRWAPSQFKLPNKYTERMVEHRLFYSPIDVKERPLSRESIAAQLGAQEADIVWHTTKPVPCSYGTDNLREEGAINLLKSRPELRSMPQRQCTWLVGENIEELKRKRSKKSFASAKARREENRASHAFPSVAMHRPVPQWWWFLLNPNGRSEFRGDENPWPNGIVDPAAEEANRLMNHRAMDWSNTAKYVNERWVDMLFGEAEPVRPLEESLPFEYESPAGVGSVDDDSETKVETVVTPAPAEPAVDLDPAPLTAPKLTRAQKKELKKLRAANDSDDEGPKTSDPVPKKLTKSQRKLAKARQREEARKASAQAAVSEPVEATKVEMGIPMAKAFEIARKNRETIDPILNAARMKILKVFLCGGHSAISEETASQPSAIEGPQVLEGDYEKISEEVIHVSKDGVAGKRPALDREVVKNAVANLMAAYSTRPDRRKRDHLVEVKLDGEPMFFDLDDPRSITGIEHIMDSITKRIGELAVLEDLMEEFRETAMRLQGTLRNEDEYKKYNSLYATHDILVPPKPASKQEVAIRKMLLADIDPTAVRVGVILYGHGRRTDADRRDLQSRGWKAWRARCKHFERDWRRHVSKRRTRAKAAMAAQLERYTNPKNASDIRDGKHYRLMLAREQEIAFIHEKVEVKTGPYRLKQARLKRMEDVQRAREKKREHHERLVKARRPRSAESRRIRGLMHKYSRLDRRAMSEATFREIRARAKKKRLQLGIMEKLIEKLNAASAKQEIELREERKLLHAHRANAVIARQVLKNQMRAEQEQTLGKSLKRALDTLKRWFRGEIPKPTSGMMVAPIINDEPDEAVMPPVAIKQVPYDPPAPSAQMAPDDVWMRRATLVATGNEKRIVERGVAYRATDSGLLIPEDQWESPSVASMLDRMRL